MDCDDPRLLQPLWLANAATREKMPYGAVPEYFLPGVTGGTVRDVPVSWLPSAIGDAVKEILDLRASLRRANAAQMLDLKVKPLIWIYSAELNQFRSQPLVYSAAYYVARRRETRLHWEWWIQGDGQNRHLCDEKEDGFIAAQAHYAAQTLSLIEIKRLDRVEARAK